MLLSRERKNEKLRERILLFVLFIKKLAIGTRVVYSLYKDFAKKLHFCVKESNDETNLVAVCRAGAAVRADGPGAGRRGRRSGTADAEPAAQTVSEEELARSKENTTKVRKIWAVAALIGVACFGGALGMAHSVAKAANNMAEQPEAAGQIRTSMMMGLVFIETVIIYALIVAILIIFVL